jgi:hypothetical protein
MSYRYRGSYNSEPKSFFNGALTWLTLGGFVLLVVFAAMMLMNGKRKAPDIVIDTSGISSAFNAQISGSTQTNTGVSLTFPAVSQRDKSQYSSEAEWKEWSASACSAASVASVLNGFGKNVKVSDVLNLMRQDGAISSSAGLFRYDVFSTIGSKYGLKVDYSENKNVDDHFNNIMSALNKGYPVVTNIQDNTYFPNGHFIVAVRYNPATDTVSVMNPDPMPGKSVAQEWSRDSLKTYFSRSLRSAIFMPR